MGAHHAFDRLELGHALAGRLITRQEARDPGFAQLARRLGLGPQRLDLRGEDERSLAHVKETRALAQVIAAEQQAPLARVPDRKGEVAQQLSGAIVAPALVGAHQKGAVGQGAQIRRRDAEGLRQRLPIVQAHIGDEDDAGFPVVQRLGLKPIFFGDPHQAMTEADGAIHPQFATVGAAMRERVRHPLEVADGDGAAVQVEDAEHRAHRVKPKRRPLSSRPARSHRARSSPR